MTRDEFLKKQKEILDECEKLLLAGKFSAYMEKMQEFLDLGDKFIFENVYKEVVA